MLFCWRVWESCWWSAWASVLLYYGVKVSQGGSSSSSAASSASSKDGGRDAAAGESRPKISRRLPQLAPRARLACHRVLQHDRVAINNSSTLPAPSVCPL